jgi:hypothetical protein
VGKYGSGNWPAKGYFENDDNLSACIKYWILLVA